MRVWIYIGILAFMFAACADDSTNNTPPPVVSAHVGARVYTADEYHRLNNQPRGSYALYNDTTHVLAIWGTKDSTGEEISIYVPGFTRTGASIIGGTGSASATITTIGASGLTSFNTSTLDSGRVFVSFFDTSTKRVSGTFSFQARFGSDSVVVTEGTFNGLPIVAP
jgi:hypothetical protein